MLGTTFHVFSPSGFIHDVSHGIESVKKNTIKRKSKHSGFSGSYIDSTTWDANFFQWDQHTNYHLKSDWGQQTNKILEDFDAKLRSPKSPPSFNLWCLSSRDVEVLLPKKMQMAMENQHVLMGDTSSNGCCFHCHVSFSLIFQVTFMSPKIWPLEQQNSLADISLYLIFLWLILKLAY